MGTVIVETRKSTSSPRLLRLLLLEQATSDAAKILRELKESGLEIKTCIAANRLEFDNALGSGRFDAVIATRTLTDDEGLELLRILEESSRETPLVLVTGESEDKATAECLKCGSIDYVSSDRMARLPFVLRHAACGQQSPQELTEARSIKHENEDRSCELVEISVYGSFRAASTALFSPLAIPF
jgi:DNA-binding response OmpR family regulator